MDRVIGTDKNANGEESNGEFVLPDIFKLLRTPLKVGDEVILPINFKESNVPTFWEIGGRNPTVTSSVATIVTGHNGQILDAILFNKLKKRPNGKQAQIGLKSGHQIYIGKITFKVGELAPAVKIIVLTYSDIDAETTENSKHNAKYGSFSVNRIYTQYGEFYDCIPAQRLVEKLYAKNVMKPYYANGWSTFSIINNRDIVENSCRQIVNQIGKIETFSNASKFLDTVENAIIKQENKHLSSVMQVVDFAKMTTTISTVNNLELKDIANSITNTRIENTYSIDLNDIASCYNPNIIFNSTDMKMLEMAMGHDEERIIGIGDRRFAVIRSWRG